MKHYVRVQPDKKRPNVSRLVVLKAIDRSGLVKKKVPVRTPQGIVEEYRWVRPGEVLQQQQQRQPQVQPTQQAPVVSLEHIRMRNATKIGDTIQHEGKEIKITAVGRHGVTARDAKDNKYQIRWDEVAASKKEEPTKVAETPAPYPVKSLSEEEREAKFNKSTRDERMKAATWDDISKTMDKNIASTRTREPVQAKMVGDSVKDNVSRIRKNAQAELKSVANYLAGDTALMANNMVQRVTDLLGEHADEFKNVKAEDMNNMVRDFVRKLIHQEVESNRHQFTDHGVRHITNNVETQQKILDALEKAGEKISGRDRLLGIFTMVNHDVGYTVPMVREGSIKASREHKEYSEKIAGEQKELWDVGKIFSSGEYDRATNYILTHDAEELVGKDGKLDPLAAATRLADNLSLFAPEKLPSVFKYVGGGEDLLAEMGQASGEKDYARFDGLRNRLYERIDAQENIGKNLKRDLKAAVADLNYMTPKFAMGALAGEISDIDSGGSGSVVNVKVRHNEFDSFLQQHFDMGQGALRKFLDGQGIKPPYDKKSYNIGEYKGKPLLRIDVEK